MTLYEILGISPTATLRDIKDAYRRAAMKHHPDRGGDPEYFKKVQRAHDVLTDSKRRERYDEYGDEDIADTLARLGEFADILASPDHNDHVMEPLPELREALTEVEVKCNTVMAQIAIIEADLKKLNKSKRAEKVKDVILVLTNMRESGLKAQAIVEDQKALCESLIRQYEMALKILKREEEAPKLHDGDFLNSTALLGSLLRSQ